MTPLYAIIARRIAQTGPMTLHDYMQLCLQHPEHGYYITRDPLGAAGDFTTAPEISQMFGELLGLALAQSWVEQGSPTPFNLIELGPGRGTLMADALRAAAKAPGFAPAAALWLIETSPALMKEQAARMPVAANWAPRLSDAPAGPSWIVANEFFDALPIRQFLRKDGRWCERMVGIDGDRLAYGLSPVPLPLGDAPDGAVREIAPLAANITTEIGARIALRGGAAIIVDYGYAAAGPMGADTFQAVRGHAYDDPLKAPGAADLTAHVDFAAIAAAARTGGAAASRLTDQGELLARLGVGARAAALAKSGDAAGVEAALNRLTSEGGMGTLFKALAIHPVGAPPPPGFEPT